MIRHEFTNIL